MKYEIVILFGAFVVYCVADISLNNNGSPPYPASGWRPKGSNLPIPGEYGAPPAPVTVQVSKENVQFAGQVVEIPTTAAEPNNAYLPPATQQQLKLNKKPDNFLRVQNLPREGPPKPFRFSGQLKQLNTGEVFLVPPQSAPFRNQRPALIRNGRLQSVPQFNKFQQQQQQPFFGQQQQQPFFGQPQQQQQQQQPFFEQQQQEQPNVEYGAPTEPNNQYGTPAQTYPYPAQEPQEETETEENSTEDNATDDPVIAVANAASNGQYYILGKDNTLQRVVYETIQTDDDRQNNGFTAQLRYAPVEPIRDPIYAYNDQGQLVKVYNKK